MSEAQPWGEEWSPQYVQEKLGSISANVQALQVTPPDAYENAAAVLEYFDPNELKPASGEPPKSKQQLLANSTVVQDQTGQLRAMLRSDRRRVSLEQMGLSGIRDALQHNPRPDSTLQQVFESFVFGKPFELERQSLAELAATLQTSEWLRNLAPDLPDQLDVQRRLERETLLQPFRTLAGRNFAGRRDELSYLQRYVAFLPSSSLLESISRSARFLLDWHEKPPLVIHGPGGMGKSALLARFILNHLEPDDSENKVFAAAEELPFVYLDFDRANLAPERPLTLLLEAGKQLSTQFPQASRVWRQLQPSWSAQLQLPNAPTELDPSLFNDFVALLKESEILEGPLLFVLDTFEEVQYRSIDFVEEVFRFLANLQQRVPRLRVVVVGRAPVSLSLYPTENFPLGALNSNDAEDYLTQRGLSAQLADVIAGQVGGSPLSLRLALEVIGKEGVGHQGIQGLQTRNAIFIRLRDTQIQGQLYRRILGHIHREDIAKLAHPGLVLRQITPELIFEVLAQPCGVTVPDLATAQSLFYELQREVSLVTVAEDGSLRHLQEVRRVMLELLRKDDPVRVRQIQERAITYYQKQELSLSSQPEARWLPLRAERLYHMLALGRRRDELEPLWHPGLKRYLGDVLEELPPASQAWLGPRIGHSILPDSILEQSELPEWELYAARRASDNLLLGKPEVALDVLRERPERTYGSPLHVFEAQACILVRDLAGARAAIATGSKELQDPECLLKLTVMGAWVDSLDGEPKDQREATEELTRVNRRFNDDPRVLRFGLHRLSGIQDEWFRRQYLNQFAAIAARVPDTRLSRYNLLARDLAEKVGTSTPELLVRLVRIFGRSLETGSDAAKALQAYLADWDGRTGTLSRYRSASQESFVGNIGFLQDRGDLPTDLYPLLIALFTQSILPATLQALYEELEIEGPVTSGATQRGVFHSEETGHISRGTNGFATSGDDRSHLPSV